MTLNMFRTVFLCVMFTVAQSQMSNNCLKVTTTYAGCDGMKLSTNGCFPAGATSSMVDPILKVNATAECSIMQRDWCPTFGGTANKDSDFCTTGYCNYRKGNICIRRNWIWLAPPMPIAILGAAHPPSWCISQITRSTWVRCAKASNLLMTRWYFWFNCHCFMFESHDAPLMSSFCCFLSFFVAHVMSSVCCSSHEQFLLLRVRCFVLLNATDNTHINVWICGMSNQITEMKNTFKACGVEDHNQKELRVLVFLHQQLPTVKLQEHQKSWECRCDARPRFDVWCHGTGTCA